MHAGLAEHDIDPFFSPFGFWEGPTTKAKAPTKLLKKRPKRAPMLLTKHTKRTSLDAKCNLLGGPLNPPNSGYFRGTCIIHRKI